MARIQQILSLPTTAPSLSVPPQTTPKRNPATFGAVKATFGAVKATFGAVKATFNTGVSPDSCLHNHLIRLPFLHHPGIIEADSLLHIILRIVLNNYSMHTVQW
jgi:hypothetical protein